jgi:hypothetical protein
VLKSNRIAQAKPPRAEPAARAASRMKRTAVSATGSATARAVASHRTRASEGRTGRTRLKIYAAGRTAQDRPGALSQ